MSSRLLIRPEPLEGESLYSWLSRLSCENVSRNKRRTLELANLLGSNKRIKSSPVFSQDNLNDLSKLTGVTVYKIKDTLWSRYYRQFLFNYRAKICPLCVAENQYWYKTWQLLPVTTCVKHRVRLTTTCKCGKSIDFYPVLVTHCECGRQYSKQKLIESTQSELKLSSYVLKEGYDKIDKEFQDRLSEVQFCLWYWYQSVRGHDDQLIRSWSYRRVVSGCKYVGSLFDSGSINITPLMSRYIDSVGKNLTGFRAAMGNCHDYMKRLVDTGYTGDLAKQLHDFEETGWGGAKLLRRSRYGASSSLRTKNEIAAEYMCDRTKVERLIEYGVIDIVENNKRAHLVELNNTVVISEKLAAWLSLNEAAKLLNISKDWVIQLVESKLIDGRKKKRQRDWLVSRKTCNSLVNKMNDRSVAPVSCFLPLSSLQIFPEHKFSQIIRGCLEEKVAYQMPGGDAQLDGMRVDRSYIQELSQREKGALLTASDLAEYLRVNLNAIYYLVGKGYMVVSSRRCRNRKVYGFSLDDIDAFQKKYCFHCMAKDFLLQYERSDLVPVLKPCNRRCEHRSKVRIYKWKDIRTLLNKPLDDLKLSRLFGVEAAAQFIGKSAHELRSLVKHEYITPYKVPSHHSSNHKSLQFTGTDLQRLKVLLDGYPELMPIRVASIYLGYDRSHVRRQFVCSDSLCTERITEYPSELFLKKSEVFSLRRLIARTVTGPELAALLGVTRNTIYRWMRSGKLTPLITPSDDGFGTYRYAITSQSQSR